MSETIMENPTNLINVIGSNPTTRILDFLIENSRESWALTEIHINSNVSYPSVKLIIPKLLEKKIIKIDKEVGKIKFYKFDLENPIAKQLKELWNTVNNYEMEMYLNK